jgi:hypothetical protein
MAAMKPRTGDGPMEAEREPRGIIVLRVPLEGGGRLVVSVNESEAKELHKVLEVVVSAKK